MKKDELIYGGCSFTPSSVVNHTEDDFIVRFMPLVWRDMEPAAREVELEHVYKLCTEIVNAPDEPALLELPKSTTVTLEKEPPPPGDDDAGKANENGVKSNKKDDKSKKE